MGEVRGGEVGGVEVVGGGSGGGRMVTVVKFGINPVQM